MLMKVVPGQRSVARAVLVYCILCSRYILVRLIQKIYDCDFDVKQSKASSVCGRQVATSLED